jgi:2,4-dienoyl-CoA reductase-like NADH-dependent reductase (Old Yellow Enzyme family)
MALPGTTDGPAAFRPAKLGPLTLKNRIIKAATFEGVMPGGTVSDELIAFHCRVAAGGVAMTTVAYCAVAPEGRTDRHCLLLNEETRPGLRRLTDAVHAEGAAVAAQIGHAGPVANARSNGSPALSPSGGFTPMGSRLRAVDEAGIARITEDYRRAAIVAVESGFDSLEVHIGHNYLLSAFLSPKLNRRHDGFGGSVENRARFARQVLRAVRDAVGDKVALTAKLNMADGVPGGLWLDDSVEVAKLFESDGVLDALELTGGSSLANPMYLFRGEAPLREFAATLPQPIRLGFGLVGGRFLKTKRRSSRPTPASSWPPSPPRSSCSAASAGATPSTPPWTRASPSWPWPAPCCANPIWSSAWSRAPPPRRCASTATSACPPSTRVPAASWWTKAPCPDSAESLREHSAQALTGGRLSAHGAARSSWPARESRVSSSPKRPTNWTPMGNPPSFQCSGSEIPGCPVTLNGGVKGT